MWQEIATQSLYPVRQENTGGRKMGKNRKTKTKRAAAWLCIFCILVSVCTAPQPVCAEENTGTAEEQNEESMGERRQKAAEWLLSGMQETGSFGDAGLINDTCTVAAFLGNTGRDVPDMTQEWLAEKTAGMQGNNDILARTYMAAGEEELLLELLAGQNPDGGFGLDGNYKSDALDSILALECLAQDMVQGAGHDKETGLLLAYLSGIQNPDGGFGYTAENGSDYELSIKAALAAAACRAHGNSIPGGDWVEALEAYIQENRPSYEACPAGNTGYMLYKALTGKADIKECTAWIEEHQEENGSFCGGITAAVYAAYLMEVLERQNRPYFHAGSMETLLSSYVLYDGAETEVTAEVTFGYHTNRAQTGRLVAVCMCGGEEAARTEQEIVLAPEEEQALIRTGLSVTADAGADYVLRMEIYVDETPVGMTEDTLKVQEVSVDAPVLDIQDSKTEGVLLEWNDISGELYRYGYRIYRQTGEGEWETRSSWDGGEKVRVLNIYPCPAAQNYLGSWMTTTVSGEDTPAGKGLFLIDTVLIDDYNRNPEQYLSDEEGNYKYDVLFFGAYDSNAFKDLNEQSYAATLKFMETGRGVLFGHDTVVRAWTRFARFAELLGIKLKEGNYAVHGNQVRVVNAGELTSYPWKIEGILDVPTSHANQQYTGGSLPATVWMEFVNGGPYDEKTGGCASAYLFSRNNLAMIQTGHSNGAATDDERKVLANTLFYLKQLTSDTQAEDKSAYDLEAPVISETGEITKNGGKLQLYADAQDYGTDYRYYVEAVPQGDVPDNMKRQSNVMETTVTSGTAGYLVLVSGEESAGTDMEGLDIICPENGIITCEMPETEEGKQYYLHIRAVDYAGNVSGETVLSIPGEEKKEQPGIFGTGYGLFGAEDVTAYIRELDVQQDVYSGGNITCAGSGVAVNGKVTASGQINLYAGNTATGEKTEHSEAVEMPRLHEGILESMGGQENMEVLDVYESTQINNPTWCMTTTGAYCPELILSASLMCDSTISIGAGSVICGQEENVVLYSVNGDISINASELEGRGLIYAPNGTVTINVQDMQFAGSIIARRIMIQGTAIQIGQENTNAE